MLMYVGLGVVLALLWVALLPIRVLSEACAGAAGLCFIAAGCAVPGLLKERRSSRYDLKSLARLQEREELRQIEFEEPAEYDSVHCIHCGTVYSDRLRICPNCGAPTGETRHG